MPLYVENTLIVLLGVSMLSLVFGVLPAWLVSTCEFPLRKLMSWVLVLPLAIPTFISAIAYSGLTDYAGPLRTFLRSSQVFSDVNIDVMTRFGVIWVMASVLFPYVYLTSRAAFITQSSRLIEVSRVMGVSLSRTFVRVVLPITWPAIFSGLSLVMMEVLNDYGTVKYYGVPTFTTGIFREWLSLGNLDGALSLAAILLIFVLVLLFVEERVKGQRKFNSSTGGALPKFKLSRWKASFALFICFIPFFAGFIVPIFQMFFWLYLRWSQFAWADYLDIALNTSLLSISGAALVLFFAGIIAYTTRITQSKASIRKYINKIMLLGYATPGAVIGVGIILFLVNIDTGLLYKGVFGLLFGYLVRFFAVSYNPIEATFQKYPNSMEEVAFSMGISSFNVLRKIFLPLLKPGIIAAVMLVFVDISKELPLTLILRPFNFETLATHAFQYAKDEIPAASAPAALLIVFVGAIPVYLLNKTMTIGE